MSSQAKIKFSEHYSEGTRELSSASWPIFTRQTNIALLISSTRYLFTVCGDWLSSSPKTMIILFNFYFKINVIAIKAFQDVVGLSNKSEIL